jgi:trimeric autotransporter adhesin
MRFPWKAPAPPSKAPRRSQRMGFTWDALEERKVLSQVGGFQHLHNVAQVASVSSTATTGSTTTSTSSSTLATAQQTLNSDVQKILSASSTTVGELTAIHTAFEALQADGLKPTSQSALSSFENSLVTSFASGTTLANNATLLAQFEALFTTTPTTQQTTDLTTAYNALAAAVTSSNITSANIATINTDFAAVLAAESSTSTATYPYFSLVTGGHIRLGGGGCR